MVPRPAFQYSGGRPGKYPVMDVMATLHRPGEAVAVPLGGRQAGVVACSIRQAIARRDTSLRLRHRRDGDDVLCWVELRPEAPRPARRRVNGGSA
jgi:hypothetical protein